MFQEKIDEKFLPLESLIESSLFALEAGEVPNAQVNAGGIKSVNVRIADALKNMWTKVIEAAKNLIPYAKEFMKNHSRTFGERMEQLTANAKAYIQNNAEAITGMDNNFQEFQVEVPPTLVKLKANGIDISPISSAVISQYFEPRLSLVGSTGAANKAIAKNFEEVFDKVAYPTGKPQEKENVTITISRQEWAEARGIYGNDEVKRIFEKVQRPVEQFQQKLNNSLSGSTTKLSMSLTKCTGTQATSNAKAELNKEGTDTRKSTELLKEVMKFSGSLSNLMLMKYRMAEKVIKTGAAAFNGAQAVAPQETQTSNNENKA